jgi:hypothetical protein
VSRQVRLARAELALSQLLEERLPLDVEVACGKALLELGLYRRHLDVRAEDGEDPWGNLR